MKLLGRISPQPKAPQMPVEEASEVLPYIVRRDAKLAAAFARKDHAEEYAQTRSYNDESSFTVHTATAVIAVYRDGDDVRR
jgi:hypothetical protein